MKNTLPKLLIFTLFFSTIFSLSAKEIKLDKVAVIVNGGVILESEIQDFLSNIKDNAKKTQQTLPSDETLRTQIVDKLISDSLIAQIGERMGVQVSDAQLDETITNMATENKLTLEQFRQTIINDGISYEKYREGIRGELAAGEVRRNSVGRRIYISDQDVKNLINSMKQQTNNDVEYHMGHILISFPTDPTQQDMEDAKVRANKVIELLNNGSDFATIAITSSGGSKALEGGDLGWKNINEMPTLFSEIIDGEKKGKVLGPIRTGLGFSIVKILDIRGREVVEVEEVESRHILIKPSIILSEAKAESTLQEFLDQIKSGDADFETLAKEHSEGPSGANGGQLGWSDPNNYDVAFKDTLATLKVDEYSKPFRSSFGWHIVQLTGRRIQDATQEMNKRKAYQLLHQRKFGLESARWLKELRESAYIEVLEESK